MKHKKLTIDFGKVKGVEQELADDEAEKWNRLNPGCASVEEYEAPKKWRVIVDGLDSEGVAMTWERLIEKQNNKISVRREEYEA